MKVFRKYAKCMLKLCYRIDVHMFKLGSWEVESYLVAE